MIRLLRHPLFWAGLSIRLLLASILIPSPVADWYVPFMQIQLDLDPWHAWLDQGGTALAFPYGYAMWATLLPLVSLFKWVSVPAWGYTVTLLLIDFGCLALLGRLVEKQNRKLLVTYWLSPIVIIATYYLGFNDLIPVFFLLCSLVLIRNHHFVLSGFFLITAVSAKFSMILALPLFLIYLFQNKSIRKYLGSFVQGALLGTAVWILPFLFSSAGLAMLFQNPEMSKVYGLALSPGGETRVYIIPLAFLLMLYAVWRVRRLNFELFHATMGIGFLLMVLLTPASPGWFIWTIPMFVAYQDRSGRLSMLLTLVFSVLYAVNSLTHTITPTLFDVGSFPPEMRMRFLSLIHTSVVAAGIVLSVRIWRETVSRNDYFRLSRKPFVMGIAGDSGSGKDTFATSLRGLFGEHSVTMISGDDYHLWDRQKPIWQVMTHLNPMANDLDTFASDVLSLRDGKSIQSRHYDHSTGRMSRLFQMKSNDIILASGLHAMYLPILRDCYDLSIYLDIDEGLRRYFKIQRDVGQRGHNVNSVIASFERREPDARQFIRPQAEFADLIFALQPIHPYISAEEKSTIPLKLAVRSRHGFNERSLVRALIGVCGLHVDMQTVSSSAVELVLEGETTAEDMALAAKIVCPRMLEFLDIKPCWHDGMTGLMQLITLTHINQSLARRFL